MMQNKFLDSFSMFNGHKHLYTDQVMTGEVNISVFGMAPVSGWDTLRNKWTFYPQNRFVGTRKSVMIWASAKLWWLHDWVLASPKLLLLLGVPGLRWSISNKRGFGPSLINGRGGAKAVWSDPTDVPLWLKLPKKLMLIMIQRCHNTQYIAVCCRPGRVPTLTPVTHRMYQQWAREHQNWMSNRTGWAPELDHRAMETGVLVGWITFSFTSRGWLNARAWLS